MIYWKNIKMERANALQKIPEDDQFNIILVGNAAVGKTAIFSKFIDN